MTIPVIGARSFIAGDLARTLKGRHDFDATVEFVADRHFKDFRYSVDCGKIQALGWKPVKTLAGSMGELVAWYRDNRHRYNSLNADNAVPAPDTLKTVAVASSG